MGVYVMVQNKNALMQQVLEETALSYEDNVANDLGYSLWNFDRVMNNTEQQIAPVLNIEKELQKNKKEDHLKEVKSSKYGLWST